MTKLGEMLANNDEKLIQLQPRLKNEKSKLVEKTISQFYF